MICTGNTMLFLDLPVDLCSHLKITESHCTISALWHLAKRAARRIWANSLLRGERHPPRFATFRRALARCSAGRQRRRQRWQQTEATRRLA